ncbi:MAG TPA: inositol monophosphatase family protein [Polyangiaceae bacterium]|jgi:myo-inositol-1(or 4)-monophosphatase
MPRLSSDVKAMVAAARRAGVGLMRRFHARHELVIELKGRADFVSAADRESEDLLRETLLRRFPGLGFLTEESAPTTGERADTRFIVDPLDGTTNFLHGIPHFAVAIALEREGRVEAGVVHDPAKGETFVAERGRGAWLGSTRLRVTTDRDLSRAVVATGVPHSGARHRHAGYLPILAATMKEAAGIRRFAAAALDLSYVAAGRFSVFFELGLAPWDLAAGALLVQEAGGTVTTPHGGADFVAAGDVLATNGRLHPRMLTLIRRASPRASSAKRTARTSRRG